MTYDVAPILIAAFHFPLYTWLNWFSIHCRIPCTTVLIWYSLFLILSCLEPIRLCCKPDIWATKCMICLFTVEATAEKQTNTQSRHTFRYSSYHITCRLLTAQCSTLHTCTFAYPALSELLKYLYSPMAEWKICISSLFYCEQVANYICTETDSVDLTHIKAFRRYGVKVHFNTRRLWTNVYSRLISTDRRRCTERDTHTHTHTHTQRERERERKRLGVKIAHDCKCKYADDSIPAGGNGCRLSCFRDRHLRIAVFAR